MDKLNSLLFMIPHDILIDPLASLALMVGVISLFVGYMYKLTPPFMLHRERNARQVENAPRNIPISKH